MHEQNVTIPFKKDTKGQDVNLDGLYTFPEASKRNGFAVVLAHGAVVDMANRSMETLATAICDHGYMCVRFNHKGRNDSLVSRTATFAACLKHVYQHRVKLKLQGVFLAGRSFGARAAISLANGMDEKMNQFIKGIAAIAYPLHVKDDLENLRSKPLLELEKPSLFISGTRDVTCEPKLMIETVMEMSCDTNITWVQDADQAFNIVGTRMEDTLSKIGDCLARWLDTVNEQRVTLVGKKLESNASVDDVETALGVFTAAEEEEDEEEEEEFEDDENEMLDDELDFEPPLKRPRRGSVQNGHSTSITPKPASDGTTPKRGRGRPPKNPVAMSTITPRRRGSDDSEGADFEPAGAEATPTENATPGGGVKRGRGRPRKNPVDTPKLEKNYKIPKKKDENEADVTEDGMETYYTKNYSKQTE